MKKIYYLSVNNENLYSEFLRFDNQFLNRSELIQLRPEEIREVIMVAIDTPNIRDLFESESCLYLPNKDHDEYFAFTHEYNHLLRKRRKSFFKLYKNDMKHWQNFQRDNSLY